MVQITGRITINIDVSVKGIIYMKKKNVWNPATSNCNNGKCLASIMNDLMINCNEVIKS